MSESPPILIGHASKKGSTLEVATSIGDVLIARGFRVNFEAAGGVASLDGYAGIVLGGALYYGRLHADARSFLRRHAEMLASLPFAVFAMGPTTLDSKDVAGARAQLDAALAKAAVAPDLVSIFGGVVDPAKFHFPLNRIPASDARDWDAIARFAEQAASLFAHEPAVARA